MKLAPVVSRFWHVFLMIVLVTISTHVKAATVTFASLAQGTVLTDQLKSQGVAFVPYFGVVGAIAASPSGNVAIFNSSTGVEFPTFGAQANFTALHQTISMHVGIPSNGATTKMVLTALDTTGNTVATTTATVAPSASPTVALSVTTPTPQIASLTLVTDQVTPPVIGDITFDDAGNAPDFAIDGPIGEEIVAGRARIITLNIRRIGNSTGPVDFSVANLNPGVTAVITPNPGATSVQVSLTADANATASTESVTFTGIPTSASVGPALRTLTLWLSVAAPVSISGSALIDVSTCSSGGPQSTLTRQFFIERYGTVGGPMNVTVDGLPANVQAQVTPSVLTFPGNVIGQTTTLTLTVIGGYTVPDTLASLHVVGPKVDERFDFMLTGTCARHQMDFVGRGAWYCQNDGRTYPLPHAQVEFFRYRSDWYDDKVGEVVTNDDGSYSINLWASEQGDYYARLHLDDHLGAHLNTSWDYTFKSYDSQHLSNTTPLLDYGGIVIYRTSGTPDCAIWLGAHKAHEEYRATMGSYGPVPDYSIMIWKLIFETPYSYLQSTNWPDAYDPSASSSAVPGGDFIDFRTNFHEFGHCIRQSLDGDFTHFTNDASLYTYARKHDHCGGPTNYGFGFNEGWAEFWAKDTGGCASDDMTIEGNVAADLDVLSGCPTVGRSGMAKVLIDSGQNSIHSDAEFRSHYQLFHPECRTIAPSGRAVTASGVVAALGIKPSIRPLNSKQQQVELVRTLHRQEEMTARLRMEEKRAVREAKHPGRCNSSSCEAVARRIARPAALAGKVEMSRKLEGVFRSEVTAAVAGQRRLPIFDQGFAFSQRHNALQLANTRRAVALKALISAASAIHSREKDYPDTDLPSYRKELERLVLLLQSHSIEDQTMESFIALGDGDRADRVRVTRSTAPPHVGDSRGREKLFSRVRGGY
ncbi:hypothetical protein [Burkholderia sp. Ac-20353]|uniref:hypothetical protein n=1 Tax=Burkholderia sp. Ac-20353 TaxID=2703894 RepID=UPI00197BD4BD|nr:hypothetical protein [Burkholderia sp. Ac-20353]MBN3788816.1 hypothetical protein [Burkholderia sp. Ac-20353]